MRLFRENPLCPSLMGSNSITKDTRWIECGQLVSQKSCFIAQMGMSIPAWIRCPMEKSNIREVPLPTSIRCTRIIHSFEGVHGKEFAPQFFNNNDAQPLVLSKVRRWVGNGVLTLFWKDIWAFDVPFINMFPRLFSITTNKQASVASLGFWDGRQWIWGSSWTRILRPYNIVEQNHLQQIIDNISLFHDCDDSYICLEPSSLRDFFS